MTAKPLTAVCIAFGLATAFPAFAADPQPPATADKSGAAQAATPGSQTTMGPQMMEQHGMGPQMMEQYGMGPQMMGWHMRGGPMMGAGGQSTMDTMDIPMMDLLTGERLEGRLAFLKAEIKITDAQAKVWDAFADALRADAKRLDAVSDVIEDEQAKVASPTVAQRLDQQERWYAARLEGIRSKKTAFTALYAALSDDQKKTADELVGPHVGLTPRMAMPSAMGAAMMRPTVTPK